MAKPVIFFDRIETPPVETEARTEMGGVLRKFQEGSVPGAPSVKTVAQIGRQCYEIRHHTAEHNWRLYLALRDKIVVLCLEDKKTDAISQATINLCQKRLRSYEQITKPKPVK